MQQINSLNDLIDFIVNRNKFKLFAFSLFGFIVFIYLSLTLPKKYMISMKFMESQIVQSQGTSQGLLSSALGSVGLGEESSLNMDKYIEMLHSHRLAENLIQDPVIKKFFFSDEYDSASDKWVKPSSFIKNIKLSVDRIFGKTWKEPSAYKLSQELRKEINIGLTLNSQVNSLFLYAEDIDIGKYILNKVFKQADEIIRSTDAIQYKKYNEYLIDSYDNNFMYQLITRNEQRLMQINAGDTYIVEVIQKPFAEDYPSSPNYLSLFLILQFLFFFLYLFNIFLIYLVNNNKVN